MTAQPTALKRLLADLEPQLINLGMVHHLIHLNRGLAWHYIDSRMYNGAVLTLALFTDGTILEARFLESYARYLGGGSRELGFTAYTLYPGALERTADEVRSWLEARAAAQPPTEVHNGN